VSDVYMCVSEGFDAVVSAEVFGCGSLLARALLVFPIGTLPPVRLLPARPRVLCSLFGCLDASSTDRLLGGADAVVSPVTFDVDVVGYCGEVILKGVGDGFPMTLGYGVPCVRAGHHCHAEALSEAGINTSPGLFGMDVKRLCVIVCVVYTFSDLGIVVLGHLKQIFTHSRDPCRDLSSTQDASTKRPTPTLLQSYRSTCVLTVQL
jgi:hypothetical protein